MGDTLDDIKITFLNGVVKEEVYIEKPLGVETLDRKSQVCKLKKALYKIPHVVDGDIVGYKARKNA